VTFLIAACLILVVAMIVAYPLVWGVHVQTATDAVDDRERLEHEKNIALLAIREADLDRAMGKLSDEDYGTLKGQYQQRAVGALTALERLANGDGTPHVGAAADASSSGADRFCASCGRRFTADERFCPACGRRRASSAASTA